MKKNSALAAFLMTAALGLAACSALKPHNGTAYRHPVALEKGRPTCTACHAENAKDVPMKSLDHVITWLEDHRFVGYQQERTCAMCHYQSFCTTCHQTNRVELKPSIRYQTDTYRRFPHTGDFLTRHRVEARVDATSCIRCHGNPRAAKTCNRCHTRLTIR